MKWTLACFLAAASLFSTEKLFLERVDGPEMSVYMDKPENRARYPIALIIAGSQKETTLRLHEALKDDLLSCGFCAITLEKRGVDSEKIDEKEFERYLSLHERLSDHLQLYKKLKTVVPEWDGRLAILGQGDGGRIGAEFATQAGQVEAIALIATGGRWSPMEETLYTFRSEMAEEGYSPQYIHGFLTQAKQEFEQAQTTPKADHKAFGYSYKYWESLLRTNLGLSLSKLECPIYSINGVDDDRVPIESVDQLAKLLEDRLILIRKEKAGREILKDPRVYKEAITRLSENF